MGTTVTIDVLRGGAEDAIDRAFTWFQTVESTCTRFDERSELSRLTSQVGVPVAASPILYEAVRFALHVADESGGAFDPTVGRRMERLGFNREHRTGAAIHTAGITDDRVSYRDVHVDPEKKTITLTRPLVLDLGAVAKGLAIDVAARELRPFVDFAIDAGGDLYLGGHNTNGERWSVGIRHPRVEGGVVDSVRVSDAAVCTSGDYERRSPAGRDHHIVDPRGESTPTVASATVVAGSAMLADALATAAFVLGPADGIAFLERHGVEGLLVAADLQRHETRGWGRE